MKVREGRAQPRQTAQKPKSYEAYSFPAPTLGLMAMNNAAVAVPGAAEVLENWFPNPTGAVMRRGKQLYATLGAGVDDVTSLFSYVVGNQRQLFGATLSTIYDITTVLNPESSLLGTEDEDILGTEDDDMLGWESTDGLDVLTGLTGGNWVVPQFATAGGTFLVGVNGADAAFLYDGTAFTATTITFPVGSTLTTADLSYAWIYKNRLWFLQKDSLNAWYLPVDSIGGELTLFPLGGVLGKGGSLTFGATWSQDVGNGLNALCAFISSEGEAAVYQGSNPASATDWGIVGVYQTGKPMGQKAHIQIGGDIAMASDIAFVPLSEALRREYSQLGANSLSAPIEALWPEEVTNRNGAPWHCAFWSARQMVVVGLPTVNEQPPAMLVMNSRTGKWARFTNWGSTCLHVFNDRLFIGDTLGRVYEGNVTGLDDGIPYTATYLPSFDQLEMPGHKTISMVRAVLKSPQPIRERMSVHTDYTVKFPPSPDASPVNAASAWGAAIWGQFVWGGEPTKKVQDRWRNQFGTGETVAVGWQITSGSIVPLDAEIIRTDVLFTVGSVVT